MLKKIKLLYSFYLQFLWSQTLWEYNVSLLNQWRSWHSEHKRYDFQIAYPLSDSQGRHWSGCEEAHFLLVEEMNSEQFSFLCSCEDNKNLLQPYRARILRWGFQSRWCIHSRFCRNLSFHSSSSGTPKNTHPIVVFYCINPFCHFFNAKFRCQQFVSPSSHLHQSPCHSRLWLLAPLFLVGRYPPLLSSELHLAAPESTQ